MGAPDVQTPGGNPASTDKNTDTPIIGDASFCGKSFARLRAQAEALGFTLIELGAGTFMLGRWGRTRELPGLREVGDLLRQIGGRQ